MKQGFLIAVEGISGAGKTTFTNTITRIIKQKYNKDASSFGGFNVTPDSSEITKFCNYLIHKQRFLGLSTISEIYLLLSEIYDDIINNVLPRLEKGEVIIYDNYIQSIDIIETVYIEKIYGNNEKNKYQKLLKTNLEYLLNYFDIPQPDITVYLQCPVSKCLRRLEDRDSLPVDGDLKEILKSIDYLYNENLNKKNTIYCSNYEKEYEVEKIADEILEIINKKEYLYG